MGPRPSGRQTRVSTDGTAGWIDRWPARVIALGVVTACAVIILASYWSVIFPPEVVAGPTDDPAAPCIASRFADVDRMRADGVIDDSQAELFKSRAEALCRDQAGQGGAPPPPQ